MQEVGGSSPLILTRTVPHGSAGRFIQYVNKTEGDIMDEEKCECNVSEPEKIKAIRDEMLTDEEIEDVANLFKILGDPTRARIVTALDNKEVCVCDLAEALGMTKSAVSHQLAILKANNIVKSRRDGKHIYYSFDDGHITAVIEIAQSHIKHKH